MEPLKMGIQKVKARYSSYKKDVNMRVNSKRGKQMEKENLLI